MKNIVLYMRAHDSSGLKNPLSQMPVIIEFSLRNHLIICEPNDIALLVSQLVWRANIIIVTMINRLKRSFDSYRTLQKIRLKPAKV